MEKVIDYKDNLYKLYDKFQNSTLTNRENKMVIKLSKWSDNDYSLRD